MSILSLLHLQKNTKDLTGKTWRSIGTPTFSAGGKFGKYFKANGTSCYLMNTSLALPITSKKRYLYIDFWAKKGSKSDAVFTATFSNGKTITVNANTIVVNSTSLYLSNQSLQIKNTKWYYIYIIVDDYAHKVTVYINGTQLSNTPTAFPAIDGTLKSVTLGNGWDGGIQEFRVQDTAPHSSAYTVPDATCTTLDANDVDNTTDNSGSNSGGSSSGGNTTGGGGQLQ